ncbi:MAG: CRTAC1 family protein [Acidobacteriota bacterium]|nr:CRTAC1 family protein [Acidobacteriota bacterium]
MNKPIALSLIACLTALSGMFANDLSRSDKSLPALPSLVFEDVAAEAGLDFQHFSGSPEKQYILESMSGGVAWIDFDRDGWMDLYLVNGGRWEELVQGKRTVSNALYRNNGDGTFANVTDKAGVGNPHWGMGVAAGDYDNDGWVDLFVCNYGSNTLYRNNGNGTFSDVTATAGVGDGRWAVSASFGDYDADGWVDLYVTNTVQFDYKDPDPMDCHYRGITVQCGPLGMVGDSDILYRNNGDGTFRDVSEPAGVSEVTPSYGLGAIWSDYDNDGDLDLYVANDQMANFLFRNQGDGTFEETGLFAGAAFSDDGTAQGSMGVDFGDYDRDGLLDIYITHFSDDYNTLFRNLGQGRFRDMTRGAGLTFSSWPMVGWGTGFVDLDHDGWEDIFAANGHVFPQVDGYKIGTSFHQRSQVFRNMGDGKFQEVSAGLDKLKSWSSRGVAFADYDNDGDIDVAVNNLDGVPWLLKNQKGSEAGNWLMLSLEGTRTNRSAIGARVTLETGEGKQMREVRGGSSYESTHDFRVHFGLGRLETVNKLTVRWTDGTTQSFENLGVNRTYRLKEGGELE